jgi:hypothetical protein
VQDVLEPPVLDVLAGLSIRHYRPKNSHHILRQSKAMNGREALKLTAFAEEALKTAEWYGAFGSGRSEDDTNQSVTWFREPSRYKMKSLNSVEI